MPVPVFRRRHHLAVSPHSASSRHAYPVAQRCARLRFNLRRVRVRVRASGGWQVASQCVHVYGGNGWEAVASARGECVVCGRLASTRQFL